jgi:cell wall-associated NlpC family hydrolase
VKRLGLIVVAGSIFSSLSSAMAVQKAVVIVPVADLRSDQTLPPEGRSDEKQQTQLLFGEIVDVIASSGSWVQVNAIEQPEFSTHQWWEGYPGWVKKSGLKMVATLPKADAFVLAKWLTIDKSNERLPLGAKVRIINSDNPAKTLIELCDGRRVHVAASELQRMPAAPPLPSEQRENILKTAALLMGDSYVWGGLSPFDDHHQTRLTGVDCSGLVHLAYRIQGLTVPRDSMEQFQKSDKIKRADLKPADLIFSANLDKPAKIVHVMLYAGGDEVIEAPRTGEAVHRTTFKTKTGVPLDSVETGQKLKDRVVYFGRLVKE